MLGRWYGAWREVAAGGKQRDWNGMEEEGARGGAFKRAREGAWERDIEGGPGTCLHWFPPFASKKKKDLARYSIAIFMVSWVMISASIHQVFLWREEPGE